MVTRRDVFLLLFTMLLINAGCDVSDSGSARKAKVSELHSSITNDVLAKDVVDTGSGLIIFGQARDTSDKSEDFYLSRIDYDGNILWEKMYGSANDERADVMSLTADSHLLLVGFTEESSYTVNGDLEVIKVDLSGNITWKNQYRFRADRDLTGGNRGNTVVETKHGYIIGGYGAVSLGPLSIPVPMLLKIGFDGHKILDRQVTGTIGHISKILKIGNGRFLGVGQIDKDQSFTFNSHLNSVNTQRFTKDFFHNQFAGLVSSGKKFITAGIAGSKILLYRFSATKNYINSKELKSYSRQNVYSISNISGSDAAIINGYAVGDNGGENVYVVKVEPDLTTDWEYVYPSLQYNEAAIASIVLPRGGIGVIAQKYSKNANALLFIRLNEDDLKKQESK